MFKFKEKATKSVLQPKSCYVNIKIHQLNIFVKIQILTKIFVKVLPLQILLVTKLLIQSNFQKIAHASSVHAHLNPFQMKNELRALS